jgi:hypothetical protein
VPTIWPTCRCEVGGLRVIQSPALVGDGVSPSACPCVCWPGLSCSLWPVPTRAIWVFRGNLQNVRSLTTTTPAHRRAKHYASPDAGPRVRRLLPPVESLQRTRFGRVRGNGKWRCGGIDRCMWGADWTRAVKLLTYKEGVEVFRVTDRLENAEGQRARSCETPSSNRPRRGSPRFALIVQRRTAIQPHERSKCTNSIYRPSAFLCPPPQLADDRSGHGSIAVPARASPRCQ